MAVGRTRPMAAANFFGVFRDVVQLIQKLDFSPEQQRTQLCQPKIAEFDPGGLFDFGL